MKSYSSRDELSTEITKRGNLLIGEFAEVDGDDYDTVIEGIDRSPRQMVAYQLGWMDLLLGWEHDEKSGRVVITPTPDIRWNQLGRLYKRFYDHWSESSPTELLESFGDHLEQVAVWVGSLSDVELFESNQRGWASSTPSAWPVWKWVHINTVAPFTSFRSKIRKWKKLHHQLSERPFTTVHSRD